MREPTTRTEEYLAKLAGMDVETREPTTRTEEYLQAISETSGSSGSAGADGREIELQNNGTYIQWRYTGDTSWTNLVALADITGPQGETGATGATGAAGADGKDGETPDLSEINARLDAIEETLASLAGE